MCGIVCFFLYVLHCFHKRLNTRQYSPSETAWIYLRFVSLVKIIAKIFFAADVLINALHFAIMYIRYEEKQTDNASLTEKMK